MPELRAKVQAAIQALEAGPARLGATELFAALGYTSRKTVELDGTPTSFLQFVDRSGILSTKRDAQTNKWKRVDFIFQLTNDEIPILAQDNPDLLGSEQDYRTSIIESFVFLVIELEDEEWTRGGLAGITREINKVFPMPALILFRHGAFASIAVIDRRQNKRDSSRDVVEKRISIIKDIKLSGPHRAHVDILCDIALDRVKAPGRGKPTNFRDLYDGWIDALSAQTLNKRFYRELAYWFYWSAKQVTFPAASVESDSSKQEEQNQIAVIRLLTRLIFVWFIKEKGLVPDALFDPVELRKLLTEDPTANPESSTYYKAILQNLFFATLNTEMSEERKWRTKAKGSGLDGHYLVHSLYRYKSAFHQPDAVLALFKQVPFLNGGLFECLDREITTRDLERNPDLKRHLVKEGSHHVIRIDGFSERPNNPLKTPNKIFFAQKEKVDLNKEYDTKGKTYQADGLIEIFSRYKFTVEENTPVEEEVALDPELLGKVFENLLASYNADTSTTARKKSGSFYTPRVVVDYMVDESLTAYFERRLTTTPTEPRNGKPKQQGLGMSMPGELELSGSLKSNADDTGISTDLGSRLRNLLSFKESGNPFSESDTDLLIAAIDSLKALDPACGSGAFPMGLLQKLIHVLHRLDPDNARWKAQNRKPLEDRLAAAKRTPDPSRRETEIEEAETALAKLDHDFSDANKPDYARKLYLIDKCLFGVDIQPIAVQIAKLRFFISLVVSQKIDRSKENCNITALPNLETKLIAANSLILIERPKQTDLLRNIDIKEKEAELSAMNERYFSARTMKTKRARREKIAALRDELAELLKSDHSLAETDAKKMAAWDPFDQNSAAPFFDPEWMFGLAAPSLGYVGTEYRAGPFDLVIGNPPYVRHETIKDQKPAFKKLYSGTKDFQGAYAGTADLFVYFIQRGVELLAPGGAFAYITSNKWYRAKYGANLRGWMNRQTKLCRVIDFGDAEVFDAIAYPTILIATRRTELVQVPRDADIFRAMNWPIDRDKSEVEGFPKLVDQIGFEIPQKVLTADSWQLEPQAQRSLLERIRAAGTPLGKFVEGKILYGIKTGLNRAYIVNTSEKNRLIAEHATSGELLKPLLMGRDIKRWAIEPDDNWLIQIESSDNKTHAWSSSSILDAEAIFANEYPAIARHLFQFKSELKKRTDKGRFYWELRSCDYWNQFDSPKIFAPEIQNNVKYASDENGYRCINKACIIVHRDWKLLLSLLNSQVSWWFSQQVFTSKQGGFYEFTRQFLFQIPIPTPQPNQKQQIETIVDVLRQDKENSRFELLLNGFTYELFFTRDLHALGLHLFDEAERAGLRKLADFEGAALSKAAETFASEHLVPGARLRTMLSDVATLDVVRIIESRG